MQEYDDWLDRTHDEAYASYYGSDDYCEECESEECECDYEEDFDEPDDYDCDSCDVCFGGVDW